MKVQRVSQTYKDMSDDELKEHIRQKVGMDPKWARRALMALYDEQDEEEQRDPVNVHHSNGRGFSPQDQEFLSSLAVQGQTASFSAKQQGWLYTLLPKYAGQLVKLVREMERMEPSFTQTIYFANVRIDSPTTTMSALTGELELDPRSMPNNITVRNPSGDLMHNFTLHDVTVGPEGPILFIYKGQITSVHKGVTSTKEWQLLITVAEPDPLPQIVEEMESIMMQKKKGKR